MNTRSLCGKPLHSHTSTPLHTCCSSSRLKNTCSALPTFAWLNDSMPSCRASYSHQAGGQGGEVREAMLPAQQVMLASGSVPPCLPACRLLSAVSTRAGGRPTEEGQYHILGQVSQVGFTKHAWCTLLPPCSSPTLSPTATTCNPPCMHLKARGVCHKQGPTSWPTTLARMHPCTHAFMQLACVHAPPPAAARW